MDYQILILSGGGVKGIAHLGALKVLENKKILDKITTFVGTSIGALICSLLVIGYTIDELTIFFNSLDLNVLIPKKLKFKNLIEKYGFDDGKKLNYLINSLFEVKNFSSPSFEELFSKTNKKLIITSTCINDKKLVSFSYESHPKMKVLTALLMSMAIPIYFIPTVFEEKIYIDGSCINHYPIELFSDDYTKVIGVYLYDEYEEEKINNIIDFLLNTIKSLMMGYNKTFPPKTTIQIPVKNISVVNFSITKKLKKKLFNLGFNSAFNFFI